LGFFGWLSRKLSASAWYSQKKKFDVR